MWFPSLQVHIPRPDVIWMYMAEGTVNPNPNRTVAHC